MLIWRYLDANIVQIWKIPFVREMIAVSLLNLYLRSGTNADQVRFALFCSRGLVNF